MRGLVFQGGFSLNFNEYHRIHYNSHKNLSFFTEFPPDHIDNKDSTHRMKYKVLFSTAKLKTVSEVKKKKYFEIFEPNTPYKIEFEYASLCHNKNVLKFEISTPSKPVKSVKKRIFFLRKYV